MSLHLVIALALATACATPRTGPGRASGNTGDVVRDVLPPPRQVEAGAGVFVVSAGTPIRLEGGDDRSPVELIRDELLATAGDGPAAGEIVMSRVDDASLGREGYRLDITTAGVRAQASTFDGLFWAAQTLLQLVDRSGGVVRLPVVHIVDGPDVNHRMVLYDLRFDGFDLAYMKRWVHELSRMKINQLMLFLSGDYRYDKYPFVAPPEKLTPAKLRELERYAVAHHVQIVPQVESLGHADGALSHDELRDLRLGPTNTYAYSPCTARTYEVLGDFYRELAAELDQSDLFHVGGDEVWDFDSDPRCAAYHDEHAQSRLYAQHMTKLHDVLRSLHRRIAIWGDMILKHPEAAEGLPRDTVIFDWDYSEDYKRFDDFPSLATFQQLGFTDIYATAAVLGFNDMYPLLPVAFQNIRGFTRAALRAQINNVCVTIWETQPGNNAENYLYGLTWAANITWSSGATSLPDFNRRFAAAWFGIREPDAAAQLDRALWFPWRSSGDSQLTERDSHGFWQIEHRTAELLYMKFDQLAGSHSADELRRLPDEAEQLLHALDVAAGAIRWLDGRARANRSTIRSMEMTNAFYRYLAHKVQVVARLATDYGDAAAARDRDRAIRVLAAAIADLDRLARELPQLDRHLRLAVAERNRGPDELATLAETRRSLDGFVSSLTSTREALGRGGPIPEPARLGLAAKPATP